MTEHSCKGAYNNPSVDIDIDIVNLYNINFEACQIESSLNTMLKQTSSKSKYP